MGTPGDRISALQAMLPRDVAACHDVGYDGGSCGATGCVCLLLRCPVAHDDYSATRTM